MFKYTWPNCDFFLWHACMHVTHNSITLHMLLLKSQGRCTPLTFWWGVMPKRPQPSFSWRVWWMSTMALWKTYYTFHIDSGCFCHKGHCISHKIFEERGVGECPCVCSFILYLEHSLKAYLHFWHFVTQVSMHVAATPCFQKCWQCVQSKKSWQHVSHIYGHIDAAAHKTHVLHSDSSIFLPKSCFPTHFWHFSDICCPVCCSMCAQYVSSVYRDKISVSRCVGSICQQTYP